LGLGAFVTVASLSAFSLRALSGDKSFSKAEKDLQTLKGAVFSYWKGHRLKYPKDVHRSLASNNSIVTQGVLSDPWNTDPQNATYGFIKGTHPNIGEYFILYTQGPKKDTKPKLNAASQTVDYSGSGIVVSNLPTKKVN
jgi:hypothetical protein